MRMPTRTLRSEPTATERAPGESVQAAADLFAECIATSSPDILPAIPLLAIEHLHDAARLLAALGAGKHACQRATVHEFFVRTELQFAAGDDARDERLAAIWRHAREQLAEIFPTRN